MTMVWGKEPFNPGTIDEDFERTLNQWSSRLFPDSPQARTLYAAGAGFVLMRLHDKFTAPEWQKLYDEIRQFTEAYMADSEA